MDTTPFKLTFGVELEFIVCYDPEDYHDAMITADGRIWPKKHGPVSYRKYGVLVSRHMVQILNENGFPTAHADHSEESDMDASGILADKCEHADSANMDFSKWSVGTDCSVEPVDNSGRYAIEVRTPVLVWSEAALEELQKFVKFLVSRFRLYTNESCGLHVHLGNENKGFNMRTLKNFCSLITLFERQLDSLHPSHRLRNLNARSVRSAFKPNALVGERLAIISELGTLDDLVSQFHPQGRKFMAFNFLNLVKGRTRPLGPPLRTIECRQHRGTLDLDLITHWVMALCNLVEMSHRNKAGFLHLVEKHIYDTEDTLYTVVDLFRDLELPKLADFYAPLVLRYETTQNKVSAYDTSWE
ncbi:hypothetical protein MMC07_007883 [Pseudocyphellaria aurata]|nr:hypothetical protein [Pseudocyphellaria aurata]